MANVRQGPSNGPGDFFNSIPPITRAWMAGCVIAVAAPELKILNLGLLILEWSQVFSRFQVRKPAPRTAVCSPYCKAKADLNTAALQIWRLFTNFFVLHGRHWNTLFKLIWM